MNTLILDDRQLWDYARTIAEVAQRTPRQAPETIADRVLAEVETARIEVDGERGGGRRRG